LTNYKLFSYIMMQILQLLFTVRLRINFLFIETGLLMSKKVWSQLPSSKVIARQMKVWWNPGNSLKVICYENAYGNPNTIQTLTNSVKASGFKAMRIPCKSYYHSTKRNIQVVSYLANLRFANYSPVLLFRLSHIA
jgi:hypothetical protein